MSFENLEFLPPVTWEYQVCLVTLKWLHRGLPLSRKIYVFQKKRDQGQAYYYTSVCTSISDPEKSPLIRNSFWLNLVRNNTSVSLITVTKVSLIQGPIQLVSINTTKWYYIKMHFIYFIVSHCREIFIKYQIYIYLLLEKKKLRHCSLNCFYFNFQ